MFQKAGGLQLQAITMEGKAEDKIKTEKDTSEERQGVFVTFTSYYLYNNFLRSIC